MTTTPIAHCPALFMTAPASGQGKTTLTAMLASWLTQQGKQVRVFKTGPDYLDPQILEVACGHPVEQIDLWMCGESYCRQCLYQASLSADLILIEGAMGMFDGEPSSADLAAFFGIPVALVLDVSGMAQTAAAIARGMADFRNDIRVAGVIANRCGSEYHSQLIERALPDDLPLLFSVERRDWLHMPERHLGLVQGIEIQQELTQLFQRAAELFATLDADDLINRLPTIDFSLAQQQQPSTAPQHGLQGKRIAIARDTAFSFIYAANLRLLQEMGAQLHFFSPLHDDQLPDADALWLPGGYPELHADRLSQNYTMLQQIRQFYSSGKPMLAECGGFLYCLDHLTNLQGEQFPMLQLLPGWGQMRDRGGCQGMQTAVLPEGDIRGHSHHRSAAYGTPEPISYGRRSKHPAPGEAFYRQGNLSASYLHLFFPSNPEAVARLFGGHTASDSETDPETDPGTT